MSDPVLLGTVEAHDSRAIEQPFVEIEDNDEARKLLIASRDTVSMHDVFGEECALTSMVQHL